MSLKISFDKIAKPHHYAINKQEVTNALNIFPAEIIRNIISIRFVRNTTTRQEGLLRKCGDTYDIKVNFTLTNGKSRLIRTDNAFTKYIKYFGGLIDRKTKTIEWNEQNAKNYSIFVLYHEIGHIEYENHFETGMKGKKSPPGEELWCDQYATRMFNKLMQTGT